MFNSLSNLTSMHSHTLEQYKRLKFFIEGIDILRLSDSFLFFLVWIMNDGLGGLLRDLVRLRLLLYHNLLFFSSFLEDLLKLRFHFEGAFVLRSSFLDLIAVIFLEHACQHTLGRTEVLHMITLKLERIAIIGKRLSPIHRKGIRLAKEFVCDLGATEVLFRHQALVQIGDLCVLTIVFDGMTELPTEASGLVREHQFLDRTYAVRQIR